MRAYLELVGGLSGDMFLAALLSAGVPEEVFEETFSKLPGGLSLKRKEVSLNGLRALRVEVKASAPGTLPNTYPELKELVLGLPFPPEVLRRTEEMIRDLFCAEAEVHGKTLEEIHLHELSAYDTLADILGVLEGLRYLGVEELYASEIPLGRGLISTAHGRLPAPAPATLKLLEGLPVKGVAVEGETVTPTGAVLLKTLVKEFGPPPPMRLKRVGLGAGHRSFSSLPNVVRLWLGNSPASQEGALCETVFELETNLDDQSPEEMAYLAALLLEAGALDVGFVPFFMKKGRPGVKLCVLSRPEDLEPLLSLIFRECGTLGVRFREVRRLVRPREIKKVKTPWGEVRVKVSGEYFKPEYEDLKRISRKKKIPLPLLRQKITAWLIENELRAPTRNKETAPLFGLHDS